MEALKSKDDNKPSSQFDLQANMVVIRRGSLKFDNDSVPDSIPVNKFNKNHIRITDMKADISLPRIKNDDFIINLKRLSLNEQSGLELTDLHVRTVISNAEFSVEDFQITLPHSLIKLGNINIELDSLKTLGHTLTTASHRIIVRPESHVYPPDLSPLFPVLAKLPMDINIFTDITGTLDDISINRLNLTLDNGFTYIDCSGQIDSLSSPTGRSINLSRANIRTQGAKLDSIISVFTQLPPKVSSIVNGLGQINLESRIYFSEIQKQFTGKLHTNPGNININARLLSYNRYSPMSISATVQSESFDVNQILPSSQLGTMIFDIKGESKFLKKVYSGNISVNIPKMEWKDKFYSGITASVECDRDTIIGSIDCTDPAVTMQADAIAIIGKHPSIDFNANLLGINTSVIGIDKKYPDYTLSGKINAVFSGKSADYADGHVTMTDLNFVDHDGKGLTLTPIDIDVHNSTLPQHITFSAGPINGSMQGSYSYSTLGHSVRDICRKIFPSLIPEPTNVAANTHIQTTQTDSTARTDNFNYHISITDNPQLSSFFKLPVRILYPVTISGHLNHETDYMEVTVDAPYLQKKDKLIRNTHLHLNVNGALDEAKLSVSTLMPSKYGDVSVHLGCFGASDRIDTKLTWLINNKRAFNGEIDLSALVSRDINNNLLGHVSVNPSQLVFNDTVWQINKADIYALPSRISIENFIIKREGQSLSIDGVASADSTDMMTIKLANINLDYVFGTLNIDNVMFGGIATGNFYGYSLLSKEPVRYTPKLHVDGLRYNGTTMGDSDIFSAWHN
ncbi:MAG: hypothetical protein K2M65_04060, partial [Muribaculaceae bacterium]|nr:hypothetical protein [Muribaculaceae bacterium]